MVGSEENVSTDALAPEKRAEVDETNKRESLKLLFEVFKHLTTLSSAFIVAICTFLEKIFKSPKCKTLIIASLGCFLISVIFSVYVLPHIALEQDLKSSRSKISEQLQARLELGSSITFMIAIILLAIFSVINFYVA